MYRKFAFEKFKESDCIWENDIIMNSSLKWTQVAQDKFQQRAFGRKKTAKGVQFS